MSWKCGLEFKEKGYERRLMGAMKQKESQDRAGKDILNPKVIEKGDTTYRIVSKSVTEYHFIVPFDSLSKTGA
jgi:hypothetical protein